MKTLASYGTMNLYRPFSKRQGTDEYFGYRLGVEANDGEIIAIANQKGGVGKTTTAVNIAASIGYYGYRVLLVDADPQGNATSGFGIQKRTVDRSTYEVLLGQCSARDAILTTPFKGVEVIPSSMALAAAELELADMRDRVMRLKEELVRVKGEYDFVLIDCPPSLGMVTLNALSACDSLIIPIQCEYYALEGLSQLVTTVRQVKRLYNPGIEIEGVFLTMYDGRLNLTLQVVDEVKKYFPEKVFKNVIPRNVRLSEAPSFGQPVLYFDRSSRGSQAYEALTAEILDKNRKG